MNRYLILGVILVAGCGGGGSHPDYSYAHPVIIPRGHTELAAACGDKNVADYYTVYASTSAGWTISVSARFSVPNDDLSVYVVAPNDAPDFYFSEPLHLYGWAPAGSASGSYAYDGRFSLVLRCGYATTYDLTVDAP